MNRTGSIASRVPPAVTSTRRPARSPPHGEVAGLAQPGVGDRLRTVEQRGAGRLRCQGGEGQGPDEAGGPGGEDGHDVGAGVDQAAADLDGLVGGDPARDTEHDAPAGQSGQWLTYLIDRSTTSGRS